MQGRPMDQRQAIGRVFGIAAVVIFLYVALQSAEPDNSQLGKIRRQVARTDARNANAANRGEDETELSGKALGVSIFEHISPSVPAYGVKARGEVSFSAKTKHGGEVHVKCGPAIASPEQCKRCDVKLSGSLPPRHQKNLGGKTLYAATHMAPGSEHIPLVSAILDLYKTTDGMCVDVGANEGLIGLFCAARGFKTVAFEALPSNYHHVRSSAIFNNYGPELYDVVLGGASNVCGDIIRIAENQDGNDPLAQSNGQILGLDEQGSKGSGSLSRQDVLTISTVRVDDVVHEDVVFLKMDVEGYEPRAMAGAMKLLVEKKVRWIHLEFSPSNMKTVAGDDGTRLLTALSALGFEIYIEDCVHNIVEPIKSEVGCGYPESVDLLQAILAPQGTQKRDQAEKKQVKPHKIKWFVKTLLDGMQPIHCCVVNLLLHRRD